MTQSGASKFGARVVRLCAVLAFTFGVDAVAGQGEAIYHVVMQGTQLVITIDTHDWLSDTLAGTALVTVTYHNAQNQFATKTYDFLKGAPDPRFLQTGHVYQRSIPTQMPVGMKIADTQIEFLSSAGKADSTEPAPKGVRGSPRRVDIKVR